MEKNIYTITRITSKDLLNSLEEIISLIKTKKNTITFEVSIDNVIYTFNLFYRIEDSFFEGNIFKNKVLIETYEKIKTKVELFKLLVNKLNEFGFKRKGREIQDLNFKEENFEMNKKWTKRELKSLDSYKVFKEITETTENFYSSIQTIDWYNIESFSYRLASWWDFQEDLIRKEMRWIAFISGNEIKEPKLFTVWFHKFFNYGEWDEENWTINLLRKFEVESINDKLDGSLIMFWKLPTWKVIAKSKTSINSEMSEKVNEIIEKDKKLYDFISLLLDEWLYPIFEYIWPDNRIVVDYQNSDLVLLWIRTKKGEYLDFEKVKVLHWKYIKHTSITEEFKISFEEVLEKKKTDKWYEWFIVTLKWGERVKVKLDSYVILHHTKDEINNIKKLIKAALNEDLDDLRTLFSDEPNTLERISKVEQIVFNYYNHIQSMTENAFEETKDYSKKEYAIFHRENNSEIFSLLMQKYWREDETWVIQRSEPDYKTFVEKTLVINEEDII